jgi:hypothetical protein
VDYGPLGQVVLDSFEREGLRATAPEAEEFAVARGARDRRGDDRGQLPRLGWRPFHQVPDNLPMNGGIAYDTAFLDVLAARLELRFDERHKLVLDQSKDHWQR